MAEKNQEYETVRENYETGRTLVRWPNGRESVRLSPEESEFIRKIIKIKEREEIPNYKI